MKRLLPFIIILSLSACRWLNPEEPIPAYLHIKTARIIADSITQGTSRENVTDGWVFAGSTFIGTFELPAKFPVIKTGRQPVIIYPGVIQNGISTTHSNYPFMTVFHDTVDFKVTHTDTVAPVFHYDPLTKFKWLENFEGNSQSLSITHGNGTLRQTSSPDSVLDGKKSLSFTLNGNSGDTVEIQTKSAFVLPRGKAVWLELNYKCDVDIETGYYYLPSQYYPYLSMRKTDQWKKIYINYTNQVAETPSSFFFRFYFRAVKGNTDAHVLLDNIKLLSFE